MFTVKSLRKVALATAFIFAWISLAGEYGRAQRVEDPLSQAQELYQSEQYDAAIQVLEAFVKQNQGNKGQQEKVASAYYLLAKIYYELREDKKMEEMLAVLFTLSPQYIQEELNEGFGKVVGEYKGKGAPAAASSEPAGIIEKQVKDPEKKIAKKKKKFPILLVIGGVVIVGLVVYLLLKKPKYTLTVSIGPGVSGNPGSGSYQYKKGTAVSYNYSLQSSYKNLFVLLDGQPISNNGSITMDGNHSLMVTAEEKSTYFLNVTKGGGVNGTPETGSWGWQEGQTATYNYSLQSGYVTLEVKLDGEVVAASGTIPMYTNHTLQATAAQEEYLTLYVRVYEWWGFCTSMCSYMEGKPKCGTHKIEKGTRVYYDFYLPYNSDYSPANVYISLGSYPEKNDADGCPIKLTRIDQGVDQEHIKGSFVMNESCSLVVGIDF
jgi:hypothetical protein